MQLRYIGDIKMFNWFRSSDTQKFWARISLTEKERAAFISIALKNGFRNPKPQHAWSKNTVEEAVCFVLQKLAVKALEGELKDA